MFGLSDLQLILCLPGDTLVSSAFNIIADGQERQRKLCVEMFREGGNPVASRSALPPVFVTAAERDYYCDDKNKTINALKAEFEELLSLIPEPSVIEWQLKMRSAKRHKDVEEVLQQLRDFKFM